eukprot:TRINITY_DN15183_c0_g1_i1.p2 TRINITY_DN15183_c0_g1~~TRINITY_DN15183_c0_g1_i1.p2  ORF type:complete len:131 (-),score=13.70 TRINITY_DN15183_c0_g1_i1:103-495(-)
MRLTVKLPELALAGVFIVSVAATAIAHGPDSQGSGQGQMPMMDRGMMGQMPMMGGSGYGQMQPLRRDLTTDEVKHMMEHRVAWAGNPNLKVGKITEKDADTIVAEIVTKDGSLVRKIDVDRHTGRMQAVQ